MKRNIIETVLGAVVLVVAAFFLVYGASAAKVRKQTGYPVTAEFSEIGSLKDGADVRISGVKIGTVASVELNPQRYLAEVHMVIDNDVQLPTDTAAKVSSESLLGGSYLALEPGADEEMIPSGGKIRYAQDAQNLEQLLGKFIFTMSDQKKDGGTAAAAPATSAPAPAATDNTAEPAHP